MLKRYGKQFGKNKFKAFNTWCLHREEMSRKRVYLKVAVQAMRQPSIRLALNKLWAHAEAKLDFAAQAAEISERLQLRRGLLRLKAWQLKKRMNMIWWHTIRPNAMRRMLTSCTNVANTACIPIRI